MGLRVRRTPITPLFASITDMKTIAAEVIFRAE